MNRELKFRAWDTTTKRMILLELQHVSSFSHSDYYKLMQYTGLPDKHKKDGYQGDIVKLFDRSLFLIVWEEYYARFQLELVEGYDEFHRVHAMDMLQFGEIVGNVYEHSHLLKVSES